MIFKLTHPADLISRMFILEYMRELTADALYLKANKEQRKTFFYRFSDDSGKVAVDINWEYCLFVAEIKDLESLMNKFIKELEVIEEKRRVFMEQFREQAIEQELSQPVDINIMDIAKAEIEASKGKILGLDGQ